MWKLFKYELIYNRVPFVLLGMATLFVIFLAGFNFTFSGGDARIEKILMSWTFYFATYLTLYLFLNRSVKEQRIRTQVVLPVTPAQIGWINALMIFIPLGVIVLLSILLNNISGTAWEELTSRLISSMGMILVLAGAFLSVRNYYYWFAGKFHNMKGWGLIVSVVCISSTSVFLEVFSKDLFNGWVHYFWGSTLLAGSIYLMGIRKSYLR